MAICMKRFTSYSLMAALVFCVGLASGAFAQSAGQDLKNAGTDTKDAAKDTAKGTAKATKTVARKTKHVAKASTHAVASGTEKRAAKGEEKPEPHQRVTALSGWGRRFRLPFSVALIKHRGTRKGATFYL